jgi:Holliday junction resolvase RusA-like endonuclease
MKLQFFVAGIPKTAGSKRAYFNRRTGKPILVDDCDNKNWKNIIRWEYEKACHEEGLNCVVLLSKLFLGYPIKLTVTFAMPRPRSHFGAGGKLKASAPVNHTSRPDATKLLRCLEDSLNNIAWKDDSQICQQIVHKVYSDKPGAHVTIEDL